MNIRARQWLARLSVIIPVIAGGCAVSAPAGESAWPISVGFREAAKFTDARATELEPKSAGILRELEKFLVESAARYVPGNMMLSIWVTDIDLAGDFELFRGPHADQVRITKAIYPPRIGLEFRLVDEAGRTVKEGKRALTDLEYQLRVVYSREDYLRYEKELLRDWLRQDFGARDKNWRWNQL